MFIECTNKDNRNSIIDINEIVGFRFATNLSNDNTMIIFDMAHTSDSFVWYYGRNIDVAENDMDVLKKLVRVTKLKDLAEASPDIE